MLTVELSLPSGYQGTRANVATSLEQNRFSELILVIGKAEETEQTILKIVQWSCTGVAQLL
jgi:hypothetical protein